MRTMLEPQFDPGFEVLEPAQQTAPILISSPHSGRRYPQSLLSQSRLDPFKLRRSEDAFIDELFRGTLSQGCAMLHAHFPRVYLDLNREPYELDPKLIAGRTLPALANTSSARVLAGLGTIPRIVSEGEEIYKTRLSLDEALYRIEHHHYPYHQMLTRRLLALKSRHGVALLLDAHSMPSHGMNTPCADIVLGDRYGKTAASGLMDAIEQHLTTCGYRVARNKPYAGGFITENHGNPHKGIHAIQIEIRRDLYMNEGTLEKKPSFEPIAHDMASLIPVIQSLPRHTWASTTALAAE
jgi:N-formylglutamate amidohydrolase